MQFAVYCWRIQTTMQCAGQFTFRLVSLLLRCNTRKVFLRTLRPHSEFCSETRWTCEGRALAALSYCVMTGCSFSIIVCRCTAARSDRNKEPTQFQAFRSDALPLRSTCYAALLLLLLLLLLLFIIPEIHQSGYGTCHYIIIGRVQKSLNT